MTSEAYTVGDVDDLGDAPSHCSNCDWKGNASETGNIGSCCLMPGEPSPVGRCPSCDSLAYIDSLSVVELLCRASLVVFDACKRAVSKSRSLDNLNLEYVIPEALRLPVTGFDERLDLLIQDVRKLGVNPSTDAAPAPKVRIVIGLDGGIIQGVTANVPVEYLVYDYDIEGSDQVVTRPALDGGVVEVYDAESYPADVNAEIIETIYKAVEAEAGSES